jgi:hypothetical protein
MKRYIGGAIVAVICLFWLVACGSDNSFPGSPQQLRDLENVPLTEPDKVRMVVNVNDYPNIVLMCIEGVGYVTTTRADRPLQESPGLTEKWCAQ